jgi:hypothetical protein
LSQAEVLHALLVRRGGEGAAQRLWSKYFATAAQ